MCDTRPHVAPRALTIQQAKEMAADILTGADGMRRAGPRGIEELAWFVARLDQITAIDLADEMTEGGSDIRHPDAMLSIGFTGTRHGMTPAQWHAVRRLVKDWSSGSSFDAHHGDCIGADAEFHAICETFCGRALVAVHPGPVNDRARQAGCVGVYRLPNKAHMARNAAIVAAASAIIAAPAEATEQERGGTWATIRMARRSGKPLAIVLPSGEVVKERGA